MEFTRSTADRKKEGNQFLSLEAAKEMGFTVDGKDYQMVTVKD